VLVAAGLGPEATQVFSLTIQPWPPPHERVPAVAAIAGWARPWPGERGPRPASCASAAGWACCRARAKSAA